MTLTTISHILVALSSLAPMPFMQFLEVTIAWGSLYIVIRDRHGAPDPPRRKEDDINSFGAPFLGIGLWQLAFDVSGKGKSITRLSPVGIRDKLPEKSRKRLSHYMGTFYTHAADKCGSGDLEFDLDDRGQS